MLLNVIFLFLSSSLALSAPIRPDVVYDDDDQIELHQVKNSVSYSVAAATVALFETKSLVNQWNGTSAVVGPSFQEFAQLCPGERFSEQPSGSYCSGILVAPDVVLTAGHCVEGDFCASTRFVFGYAMDSESRNPRVIDNRNIFSCESVLAQRNEEAGLDFALVKLKSTPNVRPVPLARNEMVKGQEITLTGFPAGLPLKVVEGTKVVWSGKMYANARLDSFMGNSGSPIVDSHTGRFLAILVAGETDFIWDEKRECNTVKKCGPRWCEGEYLMKATAIVDAIRGM